MAFTKKNLSLPHQSQRNLLSTTPNIVRPLKTMKKTEDRELTTAYIIHSFILNNKLPSLRLSQHWKLTSCNE